MKKIRPASHFNWRAVGAISIVTLNLVVNVKW